MDEVEEILREIDALRERIDLDNEDLKNFQLSVEQLQSILRHIEWCKTEIRRLQARLADERNPPRSQS
jgi:DNA repair ATPase RecN